MILVIGNDEHSNDQYCAKFKREGVVSDAISVEDAESWLGCLHKTDADAIEAFILRNEQETAKLIGKIRKCSNAPVIALLDNTTLEQRLRLFEHGVDDILSYNVDTKEVMARVAAILRRGKGGLRNNDSAVEYGAIEVFNDGRDPKINGVEFILPRRELRILEYLIANKGNRVTKSQLFNAVYGLFEVEVEENVIESHISKLRKKLRKEFGYDIIDSKRYLGYRIIVPEKIVKK